MPKVVDGANRPFTLDRTDGWPGQVSLAGDGTSLAMVGYDAAPGAGAVPAPRVVASIDTAGTVDTSTVVTGTYSSAIVPRVATPDGRSFYITGDGAGSAAGSTIVRAQRGVTASPTAIAAVPSNVTTVGISGGQLYAAALFGSDRGVWKVGDGLPTAAATSTRLPTATLGASSFAFLDRDETPGIDTVYYVVENSGVYKASLVGSTWVDQGSYTSEAISLTARVIDGVTELYVLTGGNAQRVFSSVDTAGAAPIALTPEKVLLSATSNQTLRGLAFAPEAWAPVSNQPASVTSLAFAADSGATLLGGVVTTTATVGTSSDDVLPEFELAVTASSNPAVSAVADVVISGTGPRRTISVTPRAVGTAVLTLTARNTVDGSTTTGTFAVGASSVPSGTAGYYHSGTADASTAIALNESLMLVGDDASNSIRMYDRRQSGAALATFPMPQLGSAPIGIEASARSGNTIYWIGSAGTVFATTLSGTGVNTSLSYAGKYSGLRAGLLSWDSAHGNRLGLAAACATACGIEGVEFGPDGSTAYLGLRSPLVDGNAVVVPVSDLAGLLGSTVAPEFGDPILMDLGGRTIREIRSSGPGGEYVISAADADGADTEAGWALYRWFGDRQDAPYLVGLPGGSSAAGPQRADAYESIVDVPLPLQVGSGIQLLLDDGGTVFYADGVPGSGVSPAGLRIFRTTTVAVRAASLTIGIPTIAGDAVVRSALTADPGVWSPADVDLSYAWWRGGVLLSTARTYIPVADDIGASISLVVSGTRVGFIAAESVAVSTAVVVGAPMSPGSPSISGTPKTGATLTAFAGTWVPANATFDYKWLRDGVPMTGGAGIGSVYTISASDAGHTLAVTVTGSKLGYVANTATSKSITVPRVFSSTPVPKITGTAKKGKVLKAVPGSWKPAGIALSYRWYNNGVAIGKATKASFTVRAADKGDRITVTVTGVKTGYSTVTKTSAAKKIAK